MYVMSVRYGIGERKNIYLFLNFNIDFSFIHFETLLHFIFFSKVDFSIFHLNLDYFFSFFSFFLLFLSFLLSLYFPSFSSSFSSSASSLSFSFSSSSSSSSSSFSSFPPAFPAVGLMSAEGILADPGLFYRRGVSLCPFTLKKNTESQEIEKKILDSSNEKFQTETKFCEKKKNNFFQHKTDENYFSKYENTVDLANENEIKVSTESESKIDSKVRNKKEMEWKGQIHGTPDRATLFSEYCFLSGMFFDAGGWTCLEMKDNLFEKNDSNDKNLKTTCSCGSDDSSCNNGTCSICYYSGNDASCDEHHKKYPP